MNIDLESLDKKTLVAMVEAVRKALEDVHWHGPNDIQGQIAEKCFRKLDRIASGEGGE